jgi:hypothetical protein
VVTDRGVAFGFVNGGRNVALPLGYRRSRTDSGVLG